MAVTTAIHASPGRQYAPITGGPALLRRLANSILRRRKIRHQRRLLHEMPDELLKDVGIERFEIDSLAAQIVDAGNDPTRLPPGFA